MKQFFTFLGIVAMGATAYGQADTDIVNIPDENFKRYLLNNMSINRTGDGEISYGEARAYTGNIEVRYKSISSLVGIEAFVNVTELDCSYNRLTSLDVSKNTALQRLYCRDNQLTSLDVSGAMALESLYCYKNQLTSLDVSKNTALVGLGCDSNRLTSLDVSKNTALQRLYCRDNQLTSLDISKNTVLERLYCNSNRLTSLDVSKNTALVGLECSFNQLTSLDVSKNTALESLYCNSNQLMSLDVSKNTTLVRLSCSFNQLTQLNLANGNNVILQYMWAHNNDSLQCIQIDRGFTPTAIDWTPSYINNKNIYSDNCNYPTLSTTEIKAENHLQILNPIKDNLIIKTTAKVEKIEIYNTAGQLAKVLFKGNTQVQDLAKGIYMVKITTDEGVITQKIIKQ